MAYLPNQAQAIIDHIQRKDPVAARVLTLMRISGLRITEACRLRVQGIDLLEGVISLNKNSNVNRTKGGRPRVIEIQTKNHKFLEELKTCRAQRPTGHIFSDRWALPDRCPGSSPQSMSGTEDPLPGHPWFSQDFCRRRLPQPPAGRCRPARSLAKDFPTTRS